MKKSELFFNFLLLPVDIAMFMLAFVLAFYLRAHLETPFLSDFGLRSYLSYCFYLIPVLVIFSALNGLYVRRNNTSYWQEFYRVILSVSTTILILVVTIFLSKTLFFSRLILAFTWIFAIALIIFGRICVGGLEKMMLWFGIGKRNIVIIGNGAINKLVVAELNGRKSAPYKIVGLIKTSDSAADSKYKIVGKLEDLNKIITDNQIDEIILTDTDLPEKQMVKIIQSCSDHQIDLKYVPDVVKMMTLNFQPDLVGSIPVMKLKKIPLDGWGRITKRIIDVILSLVSLVILSPLLLIVAILVKITSRGPVIYKQERIGRDEKNFFVYKFRSMYINNKKNDAWTTEKNEKRRVTIIGGFLRQTNIDEIPQLVNILRGEMSFVGPRPEQPQFVEKFEAEIPEYFRRHRVKSGLTGWAQVNGLKGDTSISERVRYDMYYIENWSLVFDFKIIIKTIGLLIYEAFFGKYEYRHHS